MTCWCALPGPPVEPNGTKTRCQCVMCHDCKKDKAITQCRIQRSPESNLFCAGCEELHGEYYRAKYGGSK
jgi:hypothetical protein